MYISEKGDDHDFDVIISVTSKDQEKIMVLYLYFKYTLNY